MPDVGLVEIDISLNDVLMAGLVQHLFDLVFIHVVLLVDGLLGLIFAFSSDRSLTLTALLLVLLLLACSGIDFNLDSMLVLIHLLDMKLDSMSDDYFDLI